MAAFPAPESFSDASLEERRAALRRGLARANLAAIAILMVVVVLAMTALVQAVRARNHAIEAQTQAFLAERNARQAVSATERAQEQLWQAKFAHARAMRVSERMGRRVESLAALREAAAMRPSLELRNEAIAAIALLDARELGFHAAKLNRLNPVAFDASNERFAFSESPGVIELRSLTNIVKQLEGPPRRVTHLAFSADGQFLAARFATGRRMVWRVETSQVVIDVRFEGRETQPHFAFSGEAGLFGTSSPDGALHLYRRASSGVPWLKEKVIEGEWQQFAFDGRGERLALARQNMLEIRSCSKGELVTSLSFHKSISRVSYHPSGSSCAVGLMNGDIMWWSLGSTNALILAGHTARITELEFSERGDWLISASDDGSSRLWRPASRQLVWMTREGLGIGFGKGDRLGFVRPTEGFGIWEVIGRDEFRTMILPDSGETATRTVDFSHDGHWLVGTSPRHLTLWNVTDGSEARMLPADECFTAHFSSNGKGLITTSARGLEWWPLEFGSNGVPVLREAEALSAPGLVRRATVTRGSNDWITFSGRPPRIGSLSDAKSIRELPIERHQEFVAVTPDGKVLASSMGAADSIHIREITSPEGTADLHTLPARGGPLTFSPDGSALVVGSQTEFVCFDARTWQEKWRLVRDGPVRVGGVSAFSRDGALLALNVHRDQIRIVRPQTGQEIATLVAPVARNVASIAFSPTGEYIAARAEGREIQVWDLKSIRRELTSLGLDFSTTAEEMQAAPLVRKTDPFLLPIQSTNDRENEGSLPWPVTLPLGGAVLAIGFGAYTFRYQRRLMRSYDEVDHLVAERNRALRDAQAELWQSQKMKALGTMAAGIAHDFNNLLSVIRLSNDFLGRGVKGDANLEEETEAIEAAVHQGKAIVESMLGYSRTTASEPRPLDLSEVVEETLGLLSQQFLSGTRLTVELDRHLPPVLLCRERLVQILLNLIVNASEAMNGAGRLAITVARAENLPTVQLVLTPRNASSYLQVVVADSGPGIPAEVLPRIFEPFFTTKVSGSTRGTGLGLSMIYAAAKTDQLGLAIETKMGAGTTFRVLVPVGPVDDLRATRAVPEPAHELHIESPNDQRENAN